MEDFVYVLIENNVYDKTNCNEQKVQIFENLEDANRELIELKNAFENYEKDNLKIFIIEDNTDEENIESDLFSYCAYEDGNYNNNHYELTIYQREI